MDIAQTFAGNEGTPGNIGGAVGGFMVGGAFGGTVADIARNALSPNNIQAGSVSGNMQGQAAGGARPFDVSGFMENMGRGGQQPGAEPRMEAPAAQMTTGQMSGSPAPAGTGGKFCANCGHPLTPGAKFCEECGTKVEQNSNVCAGCGYVFTSESKFCPECGTKRG